MISRLSRHSARNGAAPVPYENRNFHSLRSNGMNRAEGPFNPSPPFAAPSDAGEVVVESDQPGQPHLGKIFAAVHAHLDDVPRYAAGLCAKLIHEGYSGYLIRTTNDEKRGGQTTAQNILSSEQEHLKVGAAIGCKDVF